MYKKKKIVLIALNILFVVFMIVGSLQYSMFYRRKAIENSLGSFCGTVESMKQISINYLKIEQGYVNDWAKYISGQQMTEDEAIEYICQANNQSDRYAHIVDMDTYEAKSTYSGDKGNDVDCYRKFFEGGNDTDSIFIDNMQQMYSEDEDEIGVLGKYRADDTQANVISVGARVSITEDDGSIKDKLLLRVIPVESMRQIWVFPVEYKSAEIGIITKSGAYVIPSKSMRSQSFLEFIRGYNFEDDFNQVDSLGDTLMNTDDGLLTFNDSKGQVCYWYYSSLGYGTGLDIVGYIPVDQIDVVDQDWTIVGVVCGSLLMIMILDGAYIMHINRKLREAVKTAKSASKAKTRFLSTMSHDIRTPMNAIIGMTEIARKNIDDKEKVRQCLDKLTITSGHLLTLINDVLDISKVESGNIILSPAAFSVTKMIDKLINMVKPLIDKKNMELDTYIGDISHEYLIADELRLNQICINLFTNAVKYTPDNGKIILRINEEKSTHDDEHVCFVFEIEDNGAGMSEEFQKRMYETFARENDGRIDDVEGSGLGLAIVKQMVDLMDGEIICDSKTGVGTKFTVRIDLEIANESDENSFDVADGGKIDLSGINVLVAEDNDLNYEIISELLSEYNVKCTRAVNGQDCVNQIEASKDNEYDLIFMDVQMPVMNGKDAARRIRKSDRPYVRDIMIIAMTADAFAEDMRACLDAGMNYHIAKPVDMKKVTGILRVIKEEKDERGM